MSPWLDASRCEWSVASSTSRSFASADCALRRATRGAWAIVSTGADLAAFACRFDEVHFGG